MGDLATAKKAEADILQHLDDQTDDDVADDDRSPPRKKRRFDFGKAKDTKKAAKKAKKASPKKKNKKEKPFLVELGSPADSPPPASVRVGSSQASTSSSKHDATLPVPTHHAPTLDTSDFSISSFRDDDDIIVKDAFRRKVSMYQILLKLVCNTLVTVHVHVHALYIMYYIFNL